MIEIVGFTLAAIAAAGSILGSWYVSSGEPTHRKQGFSIWLCCNPINMIVMLGVILKVWSGLPLIFSLITQLYFFYTAYRGWKSNGVPS
jgi:hypothetical protein